MNQKISILGCGWLGFSLAIYLKNKGYLVKGSTTSTAKLTSLNQQGIQPFLVDISNPNDTLQEFLSSEVLIIAITSKSISDFEQLIKNIELSEVQKVMLISSTSVYPFTNGKVTEEISTSNTPLAEIEQLFRSNTNFKSTIIRFGGLFGYDRKPGNFVKNKIVEHPEGYINLIHRDDCIEIIEQIISKNLWNELFNACADHHPKRREFYSRASEIIGLPQPVFNEQSKNFYKIIESQKLISALNYEFIHADLMNI